MTIAEESRRIFAECKHFVKNRKNEKVIPYIQSGTLKKRTMMYKETDRYSKDAAIDYELGIINKEEYDIEIEAIRRFNQALANMECY